MIQFTEKEVFTTEPESKRLHRVGSDIYFIVCTRLPNDTIDSFEEVDSPEEITDSEALAIITGE